MSWHVVPYILCYVKSLCMDKSMVSYLKRVSQCDTRCSVKDSACVQLIFHNTGRSAPITACNRLTQYCYSTSCRWIHLVTQISSLCSVIRFWLDCTPTVVHCCSLVCVCERVRRGVVAISSVLFAGTAALLCIWSDWSPSSEHTQ